MFKDVSEFNEKYFQQQQQSVKMQQQTRDGITPSLSLSQQQQQRSANLLNASNLSTTDMSHCYFTSSSNTNTCAPNSPNNNTNTNATTTPSSIYKTSLITVDHLTKGIL